MQRYFLLLCLLVAVVAVVAGPQDDLIDAILNDDAPAINATVIAGASLTERFEGELPIAIATHSGNYGALDTLINLGANINDVDSEGVSLLSAAAKRGMTSAAQLLMESGASVIKKDFGYTAFHYACEGKFKNTIRMFLEAGCSPTDPTDDGKTPLDLTSGDLEAQELVLSAINDNSTV